MPIWAIICIASIWLLLLVTWIVIERNKNKPFPSNNNGPRPTSDAWAVLAMFHGGGELKDIIAAGDAVNHAVFNYDELEHAFSLLASAGLANIAQGRFDLVDEFRAKLAPAVSGLSFYSQQQAIVQVLESLNIDSNEVHPIALELFNEELYELAVEDYVSSATVEEH